MDNGFSVLMLIFGAAILLYAAALSSGNHKLLPARVQPTLRKTDKKGQTKHIAAVSAVVAVPITAGGLAGTFWGNTACLIVMGATAALLIVSAAVRRRNRPDSPEETDTEDRDGQED